MLIVENMFSTILAAVPAPSRVEPVTISGPTGISMPCSAAADSGVPRLHDSPTVSAPRSVASRSAPSTYGVVPLEAIPTTVSSGPGSSPARSAAPASSLSSAYSTELVIAGGPPAIRPSTTSPSVPKVGGTSAASRTPSRPEVPAPT